MYFDLFFVKSLPWPVDIHDSKLYFHRNIFLLQYCVLKCLLSIEPKGDIFYTGLKGGSGDTNCTLAFPVVQYFILLLQIIDKPNLILNN
jgi:hypothetical protein